MMTGIGTISLTVRGEREGLGVADPTKWDWADAILGAVVGMVSGVASLFGWFNGKVSRVHERINEVHDRTHDQAAQLAALNAHHQANLMFQGRIDENLAAINEKQDRQMEILMDLRSRDT